MGHTFSNLLVHIVFSVKERKNYIYKEISELLYAYIAGIVKNENCQIIAIGGRENHIHIFMRIHPSICISEIARKLKSNSSKWLKEEKGLNLFSWQPGYACFSVSESRKESVIKYIKNQEAHHRRTCYADELKEFLRKHNINFDEQYYLD